MKKQSKTQWIDLPKYRSSFKHLKQRFKYFFDNKLFELRQKYIAQDEIYGITSKVKGVTLIVTDLIWNGLIIGLGLYLIAFNNTFAQGIGFMFLFISGLSLVDDVIKKIKWHFQS